MKKKPPPIRDFMSHLPTEIDQREPIALAASLMEEQRIHHLPVMDGSKLYGVVSAREINLVLATSGSKKKHSVGDFCATKPLTASPVESVVTVATRMLESHANYAIIVDGGVVVGIFTVTDALRAVVGAY